MADTATRWMHWCKCGAWLEAETELEIRQAIEDHLTANHSTEASHVS